MSNEASQAVDLAVLPWVEHAVGSDLLAYLLGVNLDALPAVVVGGIPLSSQQGQVVSTMAAVKAAMPAELDNASKTEAIRAWLTQPRQDDGASVARLLHDHVTGGSETLPQTSGDLEPALVRLAIDSYPAFLLSPDPQSVPIPFMIERPSIRVMSMLIRHPQSTTFANSVRSDAALKDIFQQHEEHVGDYGMVYQNTGRGGSIQLTMFSDRLLSAAWRHLDEGNRSSEAFAAQALKELRFARDAFLGKRQFVSAQIGIMGVLLPSSTTRLELPEGVVRAVTEADRKIAPESLKGQLTGTDSAGNTVVVNYDGDLLLEYRFPYRVRAVNQPMSATPSEFPEDMQPPAEVDAVLLRLRFSLMLAVERESRVQIVPTWRFIDDPLSMGQAHSWSDPRQGVGIMPVQLTEAEVAAWGEWYARLGTAHVTRISLALSRILRALAERHEPSDVLIDSVIAWENLFGTSEGEPTFRVSTCLAVLLEDSFDARADLKKKLTVIYALRSKVVHGSRNLKQSEYPSCQEALETAIRAIRVLTTARTDILALPDGAARSSALLLGSSPKEVLE
jgi:hypothetical protein